MSTRHMYLLGVLASVALMAIGVWWQSSPSGGQLLPELIATAGFFGFSTLVSLWLIGGYGRNHDDHSEEE